MRSPRDLGEQKQNYVSAEVVLRPKEREFKVLTGDEWILSQNVKNYIPTTENMGATIKGLKDKGFQISAPGAASVSIGGTVDLFEKQCRTQLKLKAVNVFNPLISKNKVSFYGAPEDKPVLDAPDNIKDFVEGIVIPPRPMFFAPPSAFPPNPSPAYFSIHPTGDVPMLMEANRLHI